MNRFIVISIFALLLGSCSEEKNFSGDPGAAKDAGNGEGNPSETEGANPGDNPEAPAGPENPNSAPPGGPAAGPSDCKDQVVVSGAQKEIQACYDQKRIWHFERSLCLEPVAASFECNFDSLLAALESQLGSKDGSVYKALSEGRDNGVKLIACGEKNDGNTIIAQWVKVEEQAGNCSTNFSKNYPTTACTKRNAASPTTPEEVRQFVYQCLDE